MNTLLKHLRRFHLAVSGAATKGLASSAGLIAFAALLLIGVKRLVTLPILRQVFHNFSLTDW